MAQPPVTIRPCYEIEEFEAMVNLECEVWGFGERDVVPSQVYVVASKTGGQVLGAYAGARLAGFALAFPGIRNGVPYLHSHMAAVLPELRDAGVGRKLKLAQREDALARGISLIEWTFDPLQVRNAYFNICRLGVVCRRYLPNVYGSTSSPLHAGLPTDRLVAEWHLTSSRVAAILAGSLPEKSSSIECIRVALDEDSSASAASAQNQIRERFQQLFAKSYEVRWFERDPGGGEYVLQLAESSGE
ncbi:MAG TPA: GNAT family N-acetyltransferase [Candidatus Angelobacter sp.]|jgi:predicted GNAT superfamily acetyltransferase|nr:GNAT family N-acetyltransferase [Candidatus Angelobacter sp.]